jgi:hypothetical protein
MEERVRKITLILMLIWLTCAASACISEVKPILKPVDKNIPTRIAAQQKQLDLGISAREFKRENAEPAQQTLNRIKEQYERSKAQGALTQPEAETLNRMLDENSDQIYRLKQTSKNQFKKK